MIEIVPPEEPSTHSAIDARLTLERVNLMPSLDSGVMECEIRFLPSGRSVTMSAGDMTLLEATREAGLPIASACGENGACARCGLEIIEGIEGLADETERERTIKARNRIEPSLRLACRVRPQGDLTVRATYW